MTEERRDPEQYEELVQHVLKRVFAVLGVDIDNPESVSEFQADLRFGKNLRRAADRGLVIFFSTLIVGILAAMWLGIKEMVQRS